MTAMPQSVSLFNAVGGGAAALIAIDDYLRRSWAHLTMSGSMKTSPFVLDIVIGSITFTGSLIASRQADGPQVHPVAGRS